MLIDSHCHLHDPQYFSPENAEKAIQRAHYQKVEKIICIGTDIEDSFVARDFAAAHQNIYWTFGIHPEEYQKAPKDDINLGETLPVAIGEIGLDYHYGSEHRNQQIKLFERMLQLATENNLPVSFHIREAFDDFFPIIQNFPTIRGVVHSFTDNKKNLKKILNETNFYVGVNGLATYSTLPLPPLERIVLETDAPFLTPTPFRHQSNEPCHIADIANWLAQTLQTTPEQIAQITTNNTESIFALSN